MDLELAVEPGYPAVEPEHSVVDPKGLVAGTAGSGRMVVGVGYQGLVVET